MYDDVRVTDPLFEECLGYLESKEYHRAIKCFDKAIEIDPKNAAAWSEKGYALNKLGNLLEAIKCFDKAIEIDPKNAAVLNDKGTILLDLKEYNEAIECFDKAIEIEKRTEKRPIYLYNKGLALRRLEKNNEAIECYGKAIEINPNLADAWKDVGLVLKDSRRHKEAIKCFDKAIEINPNLADAWLARGLVVKDLEDYEEAIKCFDKAKECYDKSLKKDSKDVIEWYGKGHALTQLEDYEEAIKCFDKAKECYDKSLKKDSKDVIEWYGKGHALTQLEDYEEAIKCFDKAIEINPNLADAWLARGLVLTQLKKDDDAIEQFNKAIELNPEAIDAWNQKGKSLYYLGRYEEAIECHDKTLKIKESEDAYFFRGQSKCALRDYTGALEDFNKVSDKFAFRDEKATSIGHCYYGLGSYEDAENHYREAIKSNPKLARAYFDLAILYTNENKYDRAKKQLETCLGIDRNFSEARSAIKRLDGANNLDWYHWWFDGGHRGNNNNNNKNKGKDNKMRNENIDFKPILGRIVMAFIGGLMITTVILASGYPTNLAPSVVAGLIFSIAILIGVLLLPSLVRFRTPGIELEPHPFVVSREMMRSLYVMDKSHREVLFMQGKK
jgi:tetratricopeptide (TPR) repeat protein